MERFIVSARKYRPDSFESLIGQGNIATTLKNSILRKQLAHAYLFCGPRGVGKTSTARIFAKTINCLNPGPGMELCNSCESCVSFTEGRSYSIHELDAASNNSVEDIRQLNELVRIPPQIGKYSVYIIDEVHMLSSSAFNAFLKTLEEPPAHAIFILATTEKHKILPTILSRCQTYDFNRISVEDIVKNLTDISKKEGVTIDLEALHIIAQKADGAMRDALTIFDQAVAFCGSQITYENVISTLNVLDYDYYIRLTEHFLAGNHKDVLLIFDEILSKGFNALHFIGGLSSHFRDLLICKDNSTLPLLDLAPSIIRKYKEQSEHCSLHFLYDALNLTAACEAAYKSSGHPRLHIEITLLRLCKINSPAWVGEEQKREEKEKVTDKGKEQTTKEQKEGVTEEVKKPLTEEVSEKEKVKVEVIEEVKTQEVKEEMPEKKSDIKSAKSNGNGGLASMSIKDLLNSAGNNSGKTGPGSENRIGTDKIDPENLIKVWAKMAQSESSMPRLATTISQTAPVLSGETQILFKVKNDLQKNWIAQHCKARLVEFLRVNLNNKDISLEIEVTPDEETEEKLYMPQQKADFLKANNPEVKKIVDDLNLELK
ncbi:MAG: DNA polymerase III subunit gamma/tau [Bacteroidetes bacterium HGW-Bacteroidetes-7]|jgi:DNA polymerase-3 subunit gamma/tau|nr:MAG: DNA polymerase III subunit gamma/tau [Bacteroidetes bacterium HGW-Bacteroidetes-7]